MKKKTYVLLLAKAFPLTHHNAGVPTDFKKSFLEGRKIHTLRTNYPLWKKRIGEVENGRAEISVRQWADKPFKSKQIEIGRLTQEDGVGIQKMEWRQQCALIENKKVCKRDIADNDGLALNDFVMLFNETQKPLAVIHFTNFRY